MKQRGVFLRSLRGRLLLATWAASALAVLLAGIVLSGLFKEQVMRQFEGALLTQLDLLTTQLRIDEQGQAHIAAEGLLDPRWQRPLSGLYWQMDQVSGTHTRSAMQRSRSLWDVTLELPHDALMDGQVHTHAIGGPSGQTLWAIERTVHTEASVQAARWRLVVAGDLSQTHQQMQHFNRVLAWSLGVLWLLLGLAAWAQVHVGLAPLAALQGALQGLHRGEDQQLRGKFATEVQALVDDFNTVLSLQNANAERARASAGNLAHALKTPLTILSQAAQVQQNQAPNHGQGHRDSPSQASVPAALVLEQVQQAQRHLDWHLARARRMPSGLGTGPVTPVAPVLAGLVRAMQRIHAERGLQVQLTADEHLRFAGESEDLHEILGNLLDNACKWAHHRVTIHAQASAPQGHPMLQVVVEDDGPGIAPEQAERALQRGVRLDESTPGSGLGLSIVAEAVNAYEGELRLQAAPHGGLRATVLLPGAASDVQA